MGFKIRRVTNEVRSVQVQMCTVAPFVSASKLLKTTIDEILLHLFCDVLYDFIEVTLPIK